MLQDYKMRLSRATVVFATIFAVFTVLSEGKRGTE